MLRRRRFFQITEPSGLIDPDTGVFSVVGEASCAFLPAKADLTKLGIDPNRIREIDIASLQLILRAGKGSAAIRNLDASQHSRRCQRAPHRQVHGAGQLRVGVLEIELRRTRHPHIQPYLICRCIRIWRCLHPSHASKGSIDYLGAALIVASCVPLLLALTFGGQKYPWDSPIMVGLFAMFLICAVLFVIVEKRVKDPIIHMELFGNKVIPQFDTDPEARAVRFRREAAARMGLTTGG